MAVYGDPKKNFYSSDASDLWPVPSAQTPLIPPVQALPNRTLEVEENRAELMFTDGTDVVKLNPPLDLDTGILADRRNRVMLRALLDWVSEELFAADYRATRPPQPKQPW